MPFNQKLFQGMRTARTDSRTTADEAVIAARVEHYAGLVRERGRIGDGWLPTNPALTDRRHGCNQPVFLREIFDSFYRRSQYHRRARLRD